MQTFFRSTEEEFNPKPATPSHLCHSLIELLNQISPLFKRHFALLQRKRNQRHPFERVATPYQLYAWCAPMMEHTIDAIRAEDSKFLCFKLCFSSLSCINVFKTIFNAVCYYLLFFVF